MSRPAPAPPGVARWPKISASLNADGTGRLTIDGHDQQLEAPDIDTARATVLERVTRTAARLDRPVGLTTTDPAGEWELAVHPDGSVDELAARPAPEPREAPVLAEPSAATAAATADIDVPDAPTRLAVPTPTPVVALPRSAPAAPDGVDEAPSNAGALVADADRVRPPLTRSQRRWAQPGGPRRAAPRRHRARILVPLALLLIAGALAAVLATNGPDTVVKAPPAAPAISQEHSVADDAIAGARRRGAARRAAAARREAAAEKRTAQAALRKRVALRQARERRALNRRVAARQARERAAAAAARRRAASHGRAVSPPPPAAAAPRRPQAAPPPPPPPPPAATPCGDFDLC